MFSIDRILRKAALGTLGVLVTLPALADDTEIYQSQAAAQGAQPNVLFVMDTSGSMDTRVEMYDPAKTYDGSCDATLIYFTENDDSPPKCGETNNKFAKTLNACKAAATALAGIRGSFPGTGEGTALMGMFRQGGQSNTFNWRSVRSDSTGTLECKADEGVHGQTDAETRTFIQSSNKLSAAWDTSGHNLWGNDNLTNTYRLYSANYLNYKNSKTGGGAEKTRLQVVTEVATDLAKTLKDVNLGLMRYNDTANGGHVLAAVKDINVAANRQKIVDTLATFDPLDGNNGTPLSETLYEASLYLQGKAADFGDGKKDRNDERYASPSRATDPKEPDPAAYTDAAMTTYKSPIEFSCQKNYIVYLTDGAPTVDDDANTQILGRSLPNLRARRPAVPGQWLHRRQRPVHHRPRSLDGGRGRQQATQR